MHRKHWKLRPFWCIESTGVSGHSGASKASEAQAVPVHGKHRGMKPPCCIESTEAERRSIAPKASGLKAIACLENSRARRSSHRCVGVPPGPTLSDPPRHARAIAPGLPIRIGKPAPPSSLSEALQARRLQSTAARLRPARSRKRRDSRASPCSARRASCATRGPIAIHGHPWPSIAVHALPWPGASLAVRGASPVTASLPSRAPSRAHPRFRSPAVPGGAPCAAPPGAPDRIERVRLADVPCRGWSPASQVLHRRGCFVACDAFPGPRSAPSLSVCCRLDVPSLPQAAIVANTGLLH